MKTGLVLEGGAMRGIYTAGVLDVFLEHGIHFDGVIGVSAGALHGCSFVSEQKGRSLRYIKKYRNDKHFMSWWSFLHTGEVVGKQFCYHDIPERLDPFDYEAFVKSDTDFYATCTNVETGKAEYIKITDMMTQIDAMRASASMPYVSKIVNYKGIRIFIPLSLAAGETENTIRFRVIEYLPKEHRIIGSAKILIDEEKAIKEEEFWANAKEGNTYKGVVASVCSYGAFIDIGGVQGLLHISEMAWGRNQKPEDILKVNEQIEVRIKQADKENRRLMLIYEKKGPNPWNKIDEKYHIGDIVTVKVVKIMPFGAFVQLEKGIEGLVHISQICEKKIARPDDVLKVGDKVNAKIIELDKETRKIELSIRELEGTSNEYKESL